MQKKRIVAAFAAFLAAFAAAFSQEENFDEPKAELAKEADIETFIEGNFARIAIKSDEKNVKIYIDENFESRTNFSTDKLREGFHKVRMSKVGFCDKTFLIFAERGKAKTFFVSLEKDEGEGQSAAHCPE